MWRLAMNPMISERFSGFTRQKSERISLCSFKVGACLSPQICQSLDENRLGLRNSRRNGSKPGLGASGGPSQMSVHAECN